MSDGKYKGNRWNVGAYGEVRWGGWGNERIPKKLQPLPPYHGIFVREICTYPLPTLPTLRLCSFQVYLLDEDNEVKFTSSYMEQPLRGNSYDDTIPPAFLAFSPSGVVIAVSIHLFKYFPGSVSRANRLSWKELRECKLVAPPKTVREHNCISITRRYLLCIIPNFSCLRCQRFFFFFL